MAAKFTHGDSVATTRKITAKHPPPNVSSHSKMLSHGNTMTGMPGYINAHESEKIDGFKGGSGSGPKREGHIGERGGSGAKSMGHEGKAGGTTIRSYHRASTHKAGTFEGNTRTGAKHVHTANESHGSGGSHHAPPTAHGHIPGGGHAAGIDRGKMERMKATTSYERPRRKSMMY